MSTNKSFDCKALRLEKKIYSSGKGSIRLALLQEDLYDSIPCLKSKKKVKILDAGGGAGHISSLICTPHTQITLCDSSKQMILMAQNLLTKEGQIDQVKLLHIDIFDQLLDEISTNNGGFDCVFFHGVAEWMDDPDEGIKRVYSLLRPGGYLSLLVYNSHKLNFKRGVNGHLLTPQPSRSKRNKLTPPGHRSPEELISLLEQLGGTLKLQSGIRIFQHFLKTIQPADLSPEEWLKQEKLYYRQAPFSSMGEHSHILWQKSYKTRQ